MEDNNGLQVVIDTYLLKKQEERSGKGSGKWKPSMMGRCYRSHYLARADEPPTNPPDARTLRIFAVGNIFHDFVQQFFTDAQTEVKVETDDVFGYADVIKGDTVYDIKTQHSRAFHYMKNEDVRESRKTNWLQVALYGKILQVPKLCLVFISKDDLCITEYVDFTKHWIEEVEKELYILNSFWNNKTLPPAQPRAYNGKECEYCNWKNKCFQIEGKEIKEKEKKDE